MNLGLGMAQIIVTAATPMVDDGDKTFPPKGEKGEKAAAAKEPPVEENVTDETDTESDIKIEVSDVNENVSDDNAQNIPNILPEENIEEKPDEPMVDENSFEANFDAVFGKEPDQPKQVVGGRASIPEELAPHQLARLQNLKESNA